jgi:hypothetical protein
MMAESRKRGGVVKSTDFFQIVKPRTTEPKIDMNYVAVQESAHTPVSNFVDNNINMPLSSKIVPSISSPILSQPPTALKYALNRYITNDISKYFYAIDGQTFKSLLDLMNGLEVMDENTFNHHVNNSKNDFSNWIKGVFGDFRLSDSIRSLTDREKLWHFLKNNSY